MSGHVLMGHRMRGLRVCALSRNALAGQPPGDWKRVRRETCECCLSRTVRVEFGLLNPVGDSSRLLKSSVVSTRTTSP